MLLLKTKIKPSPIHGIGCFADEFIPKGTPIWKFVSGFDLEISEDEFEKLPSIGQDFFNRYSYGYEKDGAVYYQLCGDDARFFNHSTTPNVIDVKNADGEEIEIAARDIQEGEELTCDYRTFDLASANGEESYVAA